MGRDDARISHPLFARAYARLSPGAESRGLSEQRQKLLAGLSGRVLEVGAGNGLNFAHYPETVIEVTAVEPEPHLRKLAVAAAAAGAGADPSRGRGRRGAPVRRGGF